MRQCAIYGSGYLAELVSVHCQFIQSTERTELRLLLDLETVLVGLPLHIGAWPLQEAIERFIREADTQAAAHGMAVSSRSGDADAIAKAVRPLISILLYLCSDEPEIDDLRQPGSSPARPRPKKTKRGWRLFPPDCPRMWTVGAGIGAQLREAAAAVGDPTGRTVRAHLRRAHLRRGHWHGYWTGPRDAERRFRYRWLSPMVVGAAEKTDRRDP